MTAFCTLVDADGKFIGRAAVVNLPPIGYTIAHGCDTYRIKDARLLKPETVEAIPHHTYDQAMLLVEKVEEGKAISYEHE